MAWYPAESLDFITNHVILPPKLPQEAEDPKTSRTAEEHLLRLLSLEAKFFSLRNQPDASGTTSALDEAWGVIKTMLTRCATVLSATHLSTRLLARLFSELTVQSVSLLGFLRLLLGLLISQS